MKSPRPQSSGWGEQLSVEASSQVQGWLNPVPWSAIIHQWCIPEAACLTEIFLAGSSWLPCFAAFTRASCRPKRISACHGWGTLASNKSSTGCRYKVETNLSVTHFWLVTGGEVVTTQSVSESLTQRHWNDNSSKCSSKRLKVSTHNSPD